ncbi:MAG: hypothetical protein RID91_03370 [Azospirillaceae bacterium]
MIRVATATALLCTAALPAPAAEPDCAARDDVMDYLSKEFAEEPIAMGLANNGGMIEVLTGKDGRTFTILITMPGGETCLIAAGHGWEPLPVSPPADPPAESEPAA